MTVTSRDNWAFGCVGRKLTDFSDIAKNTYPVYGILGMVKDNKPFTITFNMNPRLSRIEGILRIDALIYENEELPTDVEE